jgi:spore coat protein A, manganese oxidase
MLIKFLVSGNMTESNVKTNKPKQKMSRRKFLKIAGGAAAAVGVGVAVGTWVTGPLLEESQPESSGSSAGGGGVEFYQSGSLRKFIQPFRGVYPIDANGIPVAIPDGTTGVGGAAHYKIDVEQYSDTLHPALGETTLRGYKPQNTLGGNVAQRHLGGIIVAQRGKPIQITFTNKLSGSHPIPVDQTIMGADLGENRIDTHLHGGFVPWISDGGPHAWFDANGNYGQSVSLDVYKTLNPNLVNGQAEYYYPNDQSARLMWYHDHSLGITRQNAYVGIASAYVIRDSFEAGLKSKGLPDFIENGGNEIPIVVQDKIFVDSSSIGNTDSTWEGLTSTGSLWYAHIYNPDRWALSGNAPNDPSVIPEFFGDTMLGNGLVYPEATVEARRYRFRILNACQARFLNLQLYVDDGSSDSITLDSTAFNPTNTKGPDFLVIGTEGGFLPHPVSIPSNKPFDPTTFGGSLITGPAERWDLIVDFSGYAGKSIVLYTDAPAPFPMGDPLNDYFPGAPNNPTVTTKGFGPNTRQIMRFKIVSAKSADPQLNISPETDLTAGNDPLPHTLGDTTIPADLKVRRLTLNETADGDGRLLQLLGTDEAPGPVDQGFGRAYADAVTETVKAGTSEIWQIINLTGDTHPIHFHLVNVQIISRQGFDSTNYKGGAPTLTGTARPPDAYEQGWKETVKMNPNEVTNVLIPFKLPTVPFTIPASPRTGGHEYVWHCHILEHEEHDMMRPLVVSDQGT